MFLIKGSGEVGFGSGTVAFSHYSRCFGGLLFTYLFICFIFSVFECCLIVVLGILGASS